MIDSSLGPIQDANHDANALIFAPRTNRFFAKLTDVNDNPLVAGDGGRSAVVADQSGADQPDGRASTDTLEIYAGNWSQLMVGMRHTIAVELLRERYADNFQFAFLAYLRADVQLAHPEAFSVLTGVRAV